MRNCYVCGLLNPCGSKSKTKKDLQFPCIVFYDLSVQSKTNKTKERSKSLFTFFIFRFIKYISDCTLIMTKKQEKVSKVIFKNTELGKYILERYTPKKDLIRLLVEYAKGVFTPKTLERVKSCGDFMQHLTTVDLSAKRVHKSNNCGNRFCPICTWTKTKKDAIMISVLMKAVRAEKNQEFIFLTLTAPNVEASELKSEIDRFNKAFKKLFDRIKVKKAINGYIRKLEVTYNKEEFITKEMYRIMKDYFEARGLQVGDKNPNYNTYHPHFHVVMAVNKSYFTSRDYINRDEWLEMWQDCMDDPSITQVDVRKVRSTQKGEMSAVLEVAKYSAKGNEIYHSQSVFEVFYKALKGRQLLTFNGLFKEYVTKFKKGELDKYKEKDENEYTHLLTSVWKTSKYENMLRELTVEEMAAYNEKAKFIEEDDSVE